MSAVAPTLQQASHQGTLESAQPISEDSRIRTHRGSSDVGQVGRQPHQDDSPGGEAGDVQLNDLNRIGSLREDGEDVVATQLHGDAVQDEGHRSSFTSSTFHRRTNSINSSLTKAVEKTRESMVVKSIVGVVSVLAILFTIISFAPSYGQYKYSKLAWDASVQSANQSAAIQEFQMKTMFYQSCEMNKIINSTASSPECEEALKHPPPTLPFPYMANSIMNRVRRQILEAMCECKCQQDITTGSQNPDGSNISVKVYPTDTGALDSMLLFFVLLTVATILLFRRRFAISKIWRRFFEKNIPQGAPYWFRMPRYVNADGASDKSFAQTSGLAVGSGATKRHGIPPKEQRRQTLWEAAASGNMNVVQSHLSSGMFTEFDKVHPRYGTPLCAACEGGDARIATILLIRGADVNKQGGRFFVPIQAAAYSGNTTLVQFLLAKNANVNICGGWSETALQAACERGDAQMVQCLLDAGAPVNVGGGSLGFPLQAAAARGLLDITKLLILKGADVNEMGGEYGCALNAAVASGAMELVDLLLTHGATVDLPPGDYGNCVQVALRHGYPALAKSFVEKGASGDVADEQKRTPLIEATILGDEALVAKLLEGGVDIDAQDEDRWSALHYAALEGREKIVKLLLQRGANVMVRDKFGAPALHRAAGAKGNLPIVKMLLDHGSEIDAQDVLGATALHQSAGIHEHVLQLLLERGANPNIATGMGELPIHGAVNANNLQIVKLLADSGSNLAAQDNDQATALFRSVNKEFYEISIELVNRGADLNARSANALQEALSKGNIELAKLMIAKGASVNSQGSQYGSPIQAAACAKSNSLELVTLLLDHKANVNLGGGEFGSALAAACNDGNLEVVELLLNRGANVNVRGGRYGSALRAAQFGSAPKDVKHDIISLLNQYGAKILLGVPVHDDDVWRLTPGGWTWLPPENRKDITSAFKK